MVYRGGMTHYVQTSSAKMKEAEAATAAAVAATAAAAAVATAAVTAAAATASSARTYPHEEGGSRGGSARSSATNATRVHARASITGAGAATDRDGHGRGGTSAAVPPRVGWAPPTSGRTGAVTPEDRDSGEERDDSDYGIITTKAAPERPQSAVPRSQSPATGARPFASDSAENHSSHRRGQSAHARGGPPPTVARPVMDIGRVNDTGQLPGYLLGHVIGEGGFCKVRAGIHQVTGAKTAVKLIDKARLVEPNDRRRVGREIRVLKRLAHEYIIRLFDVVDAPARIYVVMENADGGSLLDYVRSAKRLPEAEASRFFFQMCQALDYCHANLVVHRDVKLENVLLDANNNIKLIDFGLSAILAAGKRLRVHCGSPSYAAPEIVGRKVYDGPPVDVWSMGVVLFAMVTGYLPFHAHNNNKQELCQKILRGCFTLPDFVSHDAKELICAVLRVDPDKRATIPRCYDSRWLRAAVHGAAQQPAPTTYPAVVAEAELDQSRVASLEAAGLDRSRLTEHLRHADHNYYTAAYHLLAYRDAAAVAKDIGADKEAASAAAAAAGGSAATSSAAARASTGGAGTSSSAGAGSHRVYGQHAGVGHGAHHAPHPYDAEAKARAHSAHVAR